MPWPTSTTRNAPFLSSSRPRSADDGNAPRRGGDDWQIGDLRGEQGSRGSAGRAFAAIYRAFLGRANGPRAGWLLAGLEPSFVISRLREAAVAAPVGGAA